MSTRELVDALLSGDSIAIESEFQNVMSAKVSDALDDYRIQVAQNMFNVIEDEQTVEDTHDNDNV